MLSALPGHAAAGEQADIQTARRLAAAAQQRAGDKQKQAQAASQRAARDRSPAAGFGSIAYKTGTYYWGEKNAGGQRDGYGVFYYDGGRCECRFAHDVPIGAGVVIAAGGDRYAGELGGNQSGFAAGYGVYTWADGRRFEGQFAADKPNGAGVLIDALGSLHATGVCGKTAGCSKAARRRSPKASSAPAPDRRAGRAPTM